MKIPSPLLVAIKNRRFLPSRGKKPFPLEKSGREFGLVHVVIKHLGTCI
jgi:hypothetical protein